VRTVADGRRLHDGVTALFVVILDEITYKGDGDEVQHDRVDNFVRAKSCFQNSRNCGPERAAKYCREKAEWNQQPRREVRELDSHPSGCKCGDVELALGADVE
jgi:hypothetical protein